MRISTESVKMTLKEYAQLKNIARFWLDRANYPYIDYPSVNFWSYLILCLLFFGVASFSGRRIYLEHV